MTRASAGPLSIRLLGVLIAGTLVLAACGSSDDTAETTSSRPAQAQMTLSSSAFEDGSVIPDQFSFEGGNVSPPLDWSEVPSEAESLALIMDDPDAPGASAFVHWAVWDFEPDVGEIPSGTAPAGGVQGRNSAGTDGYTGPGPPPGEVHTYVFTLYALSSHLDLAEGSEIEDLEKALEGKVVGEAVLTGVYPGTE